MAIYIPGWYEQMAQSGSIQGIGDLIGRKIAPDFRANQDLQRMVQQNPAVMEQFSNMDPAALAQIQKTIGFVNKAPLTSLPAGAERQQRELKQAALGRVMATPEGAAEVDANLTGTLRADQREANRLAIENAKLTLEGRVIDNKTGQIKLDALDKETKRLQGVLDKAAPELAPTARALAYGGQVSTEALQRVYADDTLRGAFQDYYKAFQFEREANLRKSLAYAKTPQEKAMAISWVEKELDNTRLRVSDLEGRTAPRNLLYGGFSPEGKQQMEKDMKELEAARTRLKEWQEIYAEEVGKLGIKGAPGMIQRGQQTPAPITPGPLANPNNRVPLGQLDNMLFKTP